MKDSPSNQRKTADRGVSYSAQRPGTQRPAAQRPASSGSRVTDAYRQTRVDVAAHKKVGNASRYAASSGRYGSGNTRPVGRQSVNARGGKGASGGRHSAKRAQRKRGIPLKFIAAGVVVVAVAVSVLWVHPFGIGAPGAAVEAGDSTAMEQVTTTAAETTPTPIMAESEGVQLHSAVAMENLTEILIHNASYSYASPITTELTEATNADVKANHGTGREAATQPAGDNWMTGEFIRCFRSGNAGPRMSAIDCGGAPGTQVYSPVSGTVVLVKDYKLYDKYDDYQVHIQPTGRSDLDVVMIHLQDVGVQAGDTVEAGTTPIAKIRDVYAYIGESMQLKKYTAEGDNGNHTHIQVNDATDKKYHGLDDLKKTANSSAK